MNLDRAFWLSGAVALLGSTAVLVGFRLAGASQETATSMMVAAFVALCLGGSFFCNRYMDHPNRRR